MQHKYGKQLPRRDFAPSRGSLQPSTREKQLQNLQQQQQQQQPIGTGQPRIDTPLGRMLTDANDEFDQDEERPPKIFRRVESSNPPTIFADATSSSSTRTLLDQQLQRERTSSPSIPDRERPLLKVPFLIRFSNEESPLKRPISDRANDNDKQRGGFDDDYHHGGFNLFEVEQ